MRITLLTSQAMRAHAGHCTTSLPESQYSRLLLVGSGAEKSSRGFQPVTQQHNNDGKRLQASRNRRAGGKGAAHL